MKWNLTALQLAVLFQLVGGELSGRDLREQLRTHGINKDGPTFYMMMSRLAEADLVRLIDSTKVSGGHRVKERRYELTGEGQRTVEELRLIQGLSLEGAQDVGSD